MSDSKNLPAKTSGSSVGSIQIRSLLALTLVTVLLMMIAGIGVQAAFNGSLFFATWSALVVLMSLWSIGSLYITVPLSVSFLNRYYNDKGYAQIDIAHSRALSVLEKLPLRRRIDIAVTMSNLALSRLCQGNAESAEKLFQEAADYCDKNKRFSQTVTAVVVNHNLSVACIRQKKYVEAELHASKALDIAESPKVAARYKVMAAAPISALATVRWKLEEYDDAYAKFKEALAIFETAPLPSEMASQSFDQARVGCWFGLAMVCSKKGNMQESEQWCDKALAATEARPLLLSTLGLEGLNELANEYMNKQLFARAEKLIEMAYSIGHQHPFHPDAKKSLSYFEKLLLLTGRENEVADMRSYLRHTGTEPVVL